MKTAVRIPLFILLGVGLVTGGVIAGWLLLGEQESPNPAPRPENQLADSAPPNSNTPAGEQSGPLQMSGTGKTPAELEVGFSASKAVEDKLAYIDAIPRDQATDVDIDFLWSLLSYPHDPKVQSRSLEAIVDIAVRKAGEEGAYAALSQALTKASKDTRRAAMRLVMDHPDPRHVDQLIDYIDKDAAQRSVAMTALAYIEDERAVRKITEMAADESLNSADRVRAVALISITQDKEALGLLADLANSSDEALSSTAKQVLLELRK